MYRSVNLLLIVPSYTSDLIPLLQGGPQTIQLGTEMILPPHFVVLNYLESHVSLRP